MKMLFCLLLALFAGCGKAAPTKFESDLALFVTEAKRMDNQVNLGMPETDQARQAEKVRDLLAGLNPVSEHDQADFENARGLCKHLELHSRELRLLGSVSKNESSTEKNLALRNSYESRAAEIGRLFKELEP